jgi:hypothetical protein
MYRSPDTYVAGTQIDPVAEQELREWAFADRKAEEAAFAWEDSYEFGPIWKPIAEERVEREANRAETDGDDNQRYHDRYLGMPREF